MTSRQRQPKELERQLADSTRELANALERLKRGKRSAVGTLAGNLRLLLGSGEGNSLFWRVSEAKGVDVELVWLSQPPPGIGESAAKDVIVAFGPSFYHSVQEAPPGALAVHLRVALDERCFTIRHPATGEAEELTWLDAVVKVANKVAVHADSKIPMILDRLNGLIIVSAGQLAGFEQVLWKVADVMLPRLQDTLNS